MALKKDKLGRLCKEKMVDEILARFKDHPNFIITRYMGAKTSELESLRKNLKKSQASYLVVKNSLLKIIFDKLQLKDESAKIESGMGISLSGEDIIYTCKVLAQFEKDNGKFKIKGALIDGKSISTERVKELATLPPRNVLLAQVVGGIKSPITGFVNTLSGVLRKFVYVVDAIKKNKESTGAVAAQGAKTATPAA